MRQRIDTIQRKYHPFKAYQINKIYWSYFDKKPLHT